MSRRAILGAALAALALAGCSGGNDVTPLELQVLEAGRDLVRKGRTPQAGLPAFRRADLDQVQGALLEVTNERAGQQGLMFASTGRDVGDGGRIVVWRSADDVTLSMRNGVLTATRGMSGDLLSSEVQVAGPMPGPSSGGAHVQHVRSLDNRAVRLALACELSDLGTETIEIVERRHATRHLRQHCEGGGGTVINDFWIDSATGLVWQSRQWAGPHIGYLRFRQLTL